MGDFVLVEIDPSWPACTFTHPSTGLQYEFHGRLPSEAELMEGHRECPQHARTCTISLLASSGHMSRGLPTRQRANPSRVRCGKVPESSGVRWKTLYAGRRGAATAVIEANNGNLAIGQAFAQAQITDYDRDVLQKSHHPQAFAAGMKRLELAAKNGERSEGESDKRFRNGE